MADYCVSSILPKLLDPTPPTYVYSAADAAKFTTYTVLFRNGSCFETRNLPCQKKSRLLWIFHISSSNDILFIFPLLLFFFSSSSFRFSKNSVNKRNFCRKKFRASATTDVQMLPTRRFLAHFRIAHSFFNYITRLHKSKFKYKKRTNELASA